MKIGIAASESKTQYYLNQAYIDYLHEAGMQAFMLMKGHDIDMMVNMLDGVVLPGGIDIDPIYYGDDNCTSYGSDPKKDALERTIFHAFRKAGKPIFGICRGFQLIVLEYIKSKPKFEDYLSFVADIVGHQQINDQQIERSNCQHFVKYLPHLLYNKIVGTEGKTSKAIVKMPVNSMHHQGLLADFGGKYIIGVQGFKMAAWTTRGLKKRKKDQKESTTTVCEAFQIFDWGAPIMAVQWHPEELKDIHLLRNFFLKDKIGDHKDQQEMKCVGGK